MPQTKTTAFGSDFAPFMGDFGKSLQERWRKPKTDQTPG